MTEGFADEVTAVEEAALVTTWAIAAEVLPPNGFPPVFPAQVAVIWWVPMVKLVIEAEVQVPALSVHVPMEVAPSKNVTRPPVAAAGSTLAVKVTPWPK